jgi:hypothetical protein
MFLNSAGEEESEERLAVSSDDIDKLRNHRLIITLVEGINDDDHRFGKTSDRPHRFSDQCSKLVIEGSMNDIGVPPNHIFDVRSRCWDREGEIIGKC